MAFNSKYTGAEVEEILDKAKEENYYKSYALHDMAAFGRYTPSIEHKGTSVQYISSSSSNYSDYLKLFDHRGDSDVAVNAGGYLRVTWSGGIQWTNISVIKLDGVYSGSNTFDVLVETQVSGTWSKAAEQKGLKFGVSSIFIDGSFGSSNTGLRITITNQSSEAIKVANIQLLTIRPADQGAGNQIDMPVSWDALCNLLPRKTDANLGSSTDKFNIVYANKFDGAIATSTENGLMSKDDKDKLDSLSGVFQSTTATVTSKTYTDGSVLTVRVLDCLFNSFIYLCLGDESSFTMVRFMKDSTYGKYVATYKPSQNAVVNFVMDEGVVPGLVGPHSIINLSVDANTTTRPLYGIAFCDKAYSAWLSIPSSQKCVF